MTEYQLHIKDPREPVYSLPPLLRIALARDLLWDILRNELANTTHIGGFEKEDVLEAWKALEKGPHHLG